MTFPADLPALTSVRFVLALGVVLFHYQLQWVWDTSAVTGVLERARLGVDAFFILSGFVLTHAYRQALEDRRLDYRRFLAARLARIYPAHLAVLLLVLVMVGAATLVGDSFNRDFYNLPGLVATVALVHAWFPGGLVAEWNGPSWSLSAEWFAYLIFPAYAWLGFALRRRPLLLLVMAVAAFVLLDQAYYAVFNDSVVHAEARLGILRIAPEFLYGVALYRLGERLNPSAALARGGAALAALVLVAAMHVQLDDRAIVALAGPVVLTFGLLSKTRAEGLLAHPAPVAAGEASYALYLLHMPVLIGWKGIAAVVTGRPSSYLLARWEVASLLVLTIAAAFALHWVVERPARTWIRRGVDRVWTPSAAVTMTTGSQPPDV